MHTVTTKMIPIAQLLLSNTAMQIERRKERTDAEISELAETIARVGQLHAIHVRPNPFPEHITNKDKTPLFEIVAGEGRFLAAKVAGLEELKAEVHNYTDEQAEEVQMIENLQRKNLNELVEAIGFDQLMQRGHTAEAIAEKVGKSKRTVYTRLQLLKLGDDARAALREGKLDASVGLLLARLDEKSQKKALKAVLEPDYRGEVMSYRQAKEFLHRDFTFQLENAGFDTTDATLVPSAGACANCPKRSGSHPELFADIERADVCTDPGCFSSKRDAHTVMLIKKAKADGVKVIAGPEAKKAVAWENDQNVSLMSAYVRPDDKCYKDSKYRTYGQLLKAAQGLLPEQRTPKLLKTPAGKVIEVFDRADVVAKLKKAGVLDTSKSTYSPASRSTSKGGTNSNAKLETERKLRARVFRAVFEKGPTKMSRKLIEERICDEFDSAMVDLQELCEALGWDDFNMDQPAKELAKLPEADVYRLLHVMTLTDDLSPYAQATRLMNAAKEAKVDVAKIKKTIADEEKAAKAAATPAKTSKKKAARKAK